MDGDQAARCEDFEGEGDIRRDAFGVVSPVNKDEIKRLAERVGDDLFRGRPDRRNLVADAVPLKVAQEPAIGVLGSGRPASVVGVDRDDVRSGASKADG